jgi:hypothetical protein
MKGEQGADGALETHAKKLAGNMSHHCMKEGYTCFNGRISFL